MNKPIDFFAEHPKAVTVECQPDYLLKIEFDNGECGLCDMKPYLDFGVFSRLREPALFQTARVIRCGAVIWGNGDIDLDPAWVYHKCDKTGKEVAKQ